MAFNGSGTFLRLFKWATDATNGVNPNAGRFDQEDDGFAAGLSNCLTKDGQTLPTADITFNGKRIINLGAAVNSTDALNLSTADGRYLKISVGGVAGGWPVLDGSALVPVSNIPNLDASKITTGVFAAARIPTISFSTISGTIANAQVPQSAVTQFQGVLSLSGSQIVSGNVPSATTATSATSATNTTDLAGASFKTGFLEMPINNQANTYTFVLADSGKLVAHISNANHTYTIPPNSSVAFAVGTVIGLVTTGTGSIITLAPGAGVQLFWAGTTASGTRTIIPAGQASITKIQSDTWIVSGSGVA